MAAVSVWFFEPLKARVRRYWQTWHIKRQEERLLWAFLVLATEVSPNEKQAAPVYAREAAKRAGLRDPEPVLDRLVHNDHIRPDTVYPRHFHLSYAGRERANAVRPSLWELLSATGAGKPRS